MNLAHRPRVPAIRRSLMLAGLAAIAAPSLPAFAQTAEAQEASAQTLAELDAFWTESARTAREGDYEAAAALYHPEAVLVSVRRGRTLAIAGVLPEWKIEYDNTKAGVTSSTVDFRFSQRLHDEATAHETGIFNYRFVSETGEVNDQYIHFDALLVKRDGRWLMLMEYQRGPATLEEWEALGR